ncbi:MAG: hypothetical protein M1587_07520 [Thaumarchaeota archaeon]|nr:hypothetical protein [Nitrososphaerota archaeon]
MAQEIGEEKEKKQEISPWVPKVICAHSFLSTYWNAWVWLQWLEGDIGEIENWGETELDTVIRALFLLPSKLLLSLCRIPFIPLDIYRYIVSHLQDHSE